MYQYVLLACALQGACILARYTSRGGMHAFLCFAHGGFPLHEGMRLKLDSREASIEERSSDLISASYT